MKRWIYESGSGVLACHCALSASHSIVKIVWLTYYVLRLLIIIVLYFITTISNYACKNHLIARLSHTASNRTKAKEQQVVLLYIFYVAQEELWASTKDSVDIVLDIATVAMYLYLYVNFRDTKMHQVGLTTSVTKAVVGVTKMQHESEILQWELGQDL